MDPDNDVMFVEGFLDAMIRNLDRQMLGDAAIQPIARDWSFDTLIKEWCVEDAE